jgi:hypothetical protein
MLFNNKTEPSIIKKTENTILEHFKKIDNN